MKFEVEEEQLKAPEYRLHASVLRSSIIGEGISFSWEENDEQRADTIVDLHCILRLYCSPRLSPTCRPSLSSGAYENGYMYV